MEEDRYNKEYTYGKVAFYLADITPDNEECRFLMLKVLEQAVRDYISLPNASSVHEQERWTLAKDFLFDDDYLIDWGGKELSTEEFLDIIDLDITWVREQTRRQFRIRGRQNGTQR